MATARASRCRVCAICEEAPPAGGELVPWDLGNGIKCEVCDFCAPSAPGHAMPSTPRETGRAAMNRQRCRFCAYAGSRRRERVDLRTARSWARQQLRGNKDLLHVDIYQWVEKEDGPHLEHYSRILALDIVRDFNSLRRDLVPPSAPQAPLETGGSDGGG